MKLTESLAGNWFRYIDDPKGREGDGSIKIGCAASNTSLVSGESLQLVTVFDPEKAVKRIKAKWIIEIVDKPENAAELLPTAKQITALKLSPKATAAYKANLKVVA